MQRGKVTAVSHCLRSALSSIAPRSQTMNLICNRSARPRRRCNVEDMNKKEGMLAQLRKGGAIFKQCGFGGQRLPSPCFHSVNYDRTPRRRHRCFGGGKSKVASVAAVLKSMRLGRSIVTLERFLAEIKTRRECERGRENGPWQGLDGPWVRFVMPSKCRDERPSPLQVRPSISEDEALLAHGTRQRQSR